MKNTKNEKFKSDQFISKKYNLCIYPLNKKNRSFMFSISEFLLVTI